MPMTIDELKRREMIDEEEIDLTELPEDAIPRWQWVRPGGRKGRPATVWIDTEVFRWLRARHPDRDLGQAVEMVLRAAFDSENDPGRSEAA
jgi:hypothetical protein